MLKKMILPIIFSFACACGGTKQQTMVPQTPQTESITIDNWSLTIPSTFVKDMSPNNSDFIAFDDTSTHLSIVAMSEKTPSMGIPSVGSDGTKIYPSINVIAKNVIKSMRTKGALYISSKVLISKNMDTAIVFFSTIATSIEIYIVLSPDHATNLKFACILPKDTATTDTQKQECANIFNTIKYSK